MLYNQAEAIIQKIENELVQYIDKTFDLSYHGALSGIYGSYLFLFQYYKYMNDDQCVDMINEKFENHLNESLNNMSTYTYTNGLAGILYMLKFMQDNDLISININAYKSVFDKILTKEMLTDISIENIDFLHGALGVAICLLKIGTTSKTVNFFIDALFSKAMIDTNNGTCKWKFPFGLNNGAPTYNISLSHGMSGLLIFLCRIKINGYESSKIDFMIKSGVNYLVEQLFYSSKFVSQFPRLSKEVSFEESRLAWCYGDLGVSYAIFLSGKTMRDDTLQNLGIKLLTQTTERLTYTQTAVIDASICHGSAGLYMFYNRLYLETKLPVFYHSAQYWIEKTIQYSTFCDGIAGYKSFVQNKWICDYDLLTGVSGIGMSLLSFLQHDTQAWDEIFLLSYCRSW